jgi:hypothetical protein
MPTATPIRLCAALLLCLCLLPALPASAASTTSWKISAFPGGPAAELSLALHHDGGQAAQAVGAHA